MKGNFQPDDVILDEGVGYSSSQAIQISTFRRAGWSLCGDIYSELSTFSRSSTVHGYPCRAELLAQSCYKRETTINTKMRGRPCFEGQVEKQLPPVSVTLLEKISVILDIAEF